jgi:hypothetical protein
MVLWIASFWIEHELWFVENGWPRLDIISRGGTFQIGPVKGYHYPSYLTNSSGFSLRQRKARGQFEHTWQFIGFGYSSVTTSCAPGKRVAGHLTAVVFPQ